MNIEKLIKDREEFKAKAKIRSEQTEAQIKANNQQIQLRNKEMQAVIDNAAMAIQMALKDKPIRSNGFTR